MKKYRKTVFIMTVLLGITTFNIIARNKQDEPKFKNLQVYPKDVSKEKLDSDMHLISRALGVKCGFCHVRVDNKFDFSLDDKDHKKQARDMMRMTNYLNKTYFGADPDTAKPKDIAINCYTCHRGEEEPIVPWDTAHVKPAHPEERPWPGPPPPPSAPVNQ